MDLPAALRAGADLGGEPSFIGETAALSPEQLSIAIAKPMVRRARVDPGLWVGLQLGFLCLSASNPAHALFSGSGLQTPAVQVWHNSEVMLLYYLAGSEYLDPQSRRELVKFLKQKRPKPNIISIHNGNRWVFFLVPDKVGFIYFYLMFK